MVKKVLLSVAATAFIIGGGVTLQPTPAEASWSKTKASKSWSVQGHMAKKHEWLARKKAWWQAGWVKKR